MKMKILVNWQLESETSYVKWFAIGKLRALHAKIGAISFKANNRHTKSLAYKTLKQTNMYEKALHNCFCNEGLQYFFTDTL